VTISDVLQAIVSVGLAYRGTVQLHDEETHPSLNARSIVLVGFGGDGGWESFVTSREWRDGGANLLDRWSKRVLCSVAEDVGATPLFPFEGPPWWPFQTWARKAEALFQTPIGILIHPKWGLWHSWRGALAFRSSVDAPPPEVGVSPCESCEERRCLRACPVGAFKTSGYDAARCLEYLDEPNGSSCMTYGCLARRACPIGAQYRYQAERAGFHMTAFRDGVMRSR
jgi:ferredoxin-like protein FixX